MELLLYGTIRIYKNILFYLFYVLSPMCNASPDRAGVGVCVCFPRIQLSIELKVAFNIYVFVNEINKTSDLEK